MAEYEPEAAEDAGVVQGISEDIRARIQGRLERMLAQRDSVWFG
jgi:hypothetical protein